MKATCISACEIAGIGIVSAGETVELHDGFYNDPRIRMHFAIEESTVKDKNAKPLDMLAEADARRERFAKHLCNHTEQIKALNVLRDFGADIPREIIETDGEDALTEPERIAKIVELWCDNFGYDFPTDPKKDEKKGDRKPPKGKGRKGSQKDQEETSEGEQQNGEKAQDGEEEQPGGSDGVHGHGDPTGVPGDVGAAQMDLLDKLNGKS